MLELSRGGDTISNNTTKWTVLVVMIVVAIAVVWYGTWGPGSKPPLYRDVLPIYPGATNVNWGKGTKRDPDLERDVPIHTLSYDTTASPEEIGEFYLETMAEIGWGTHMYMEPSSIRSRLAFLGGLEIHHYFYDPERPTRPIGSYYAALRADPSPDGTLIHVMAAAGMVSPPLPTPVRKDR